MDATRAGDLEELEKVLKNPGSSSWHKREAESAIKKISNESGLVRSMRERLIKEMKAGRADNVRDITEYVRKHSKYQ